MNELERIDCEEAVQRLAEYLDQELDPDGSTELEQHLERCRSCFSRAEFERQLKTSIRENLGSADVPAPFEKRVRLLLKGLVEGE